MAGTAWADGPPGRVVSINLCTDQLAMMVAAPGQLVSVSALARDPLSSSMTEEAAAYPQNSGQAEEVFLLHPDLVLAGTYTTRTTVEMLRRLGIPVVELPPATSVADVGEGLTVIGAALGQPERAARLRAAFEADLAALTPPPGERPRAALYYANGYTTGKGTLSDNILDQAGLANLAATAGVTGGGILPLERLVMAAPDIVVSGHPYPGASRSEEILRHPALAALRERAISARTSDADWICNTPHILRAVAQMAGLRREWEPAGQ